MKKYIDIKHEIGCENKPTSSAKFQRIRFCSEEVGLKWPISADLCLGIWGEVLELGCSEGWIRLRVIKNGDEMRVKVKFESGRIFTRKKKFKSGRQNEVVIFSAISSLSFDSHTTGI